MKNTNSSGKERRIASANQTILAFKNGVYDTSETSSSLIDNLSPSKDKGFVTTIKVVDEDVVNAVHEQSKKMKTGVMNFASATHPGGGYESGANAQEETLCRNSFLGFELEKFKETYYSKNRKDNRGGLYSRNLIYSKNVLFIKNTNGSHEYFVEKPSKADVVTVAAPNQRMYDGTISQRKYSLEIAHKIQLTLRAFKENNCESIILGAFGCGVFGNHPMKVAKIFKLLLESEEFKGSFKEVRFSIYGKGKNLTAFNQVFNSSEQ